MSQRYKCLPHFHTVHYQYSSVLNATVFPVCSSNKINQCPLRFCTGNDEMRVPADINQAAALKRHCQLNFTKKEEKPFFAEDLLLFCCFPEIFPEPSRHHLQFISIFCSCERLLHFLCALFCGTILFVRGFQSLTLCAPPHSDTTEPQCQTGILYCNMKMVNIHGFL